MQGPGKPAVLVVYCVNYLLLGGATRLTAMCSVAPSSCVSLSHNHHGEQIKARLAAVLCTTGVTVLVTCLLARPVSAFHLHTACEDIVAVVCHLTISNLHVKQKVKVPSYGVPSRKWGGSVFDLVIVFQKVPPSHGPRSAWPSPHKQHLSQHLPLHMTLRGNADLGSSSPLRAGPCVHWHVFMV